jgi:hypothetical protein
MYADFLRHANGWRGFLQATNLFGTAELNGGGQMSHACSRRLNLDPACRLSIDPGLVAAS